MKRAASGNTGRPGTSRKQQDTTGARKGRATSEHNVPSRTPRPGKSKRFDPKALAADDKRRQQQEAATRRAEAEETRSRKRNSREERPAPDRTERTQRSRSAEGRHEAPQRGARSKDRDFRDFNDAEPRENRAAAKKEAPMTLNKYLAHSGISSRRDAAEIIKQGKVKVNGEVKTEPGYRVQPSDVVKLDGKLMKPVEHKTYLLLNKPKGFITTTEDDKGRRTVMELVQSAGVDRLFPVGRLDRNTTGLLLLTNDGDLAQKLSHPKYEARKIYQVTLDQPLPKADFDKILQGVMLEDGMAHVDKLAYLAEKNELGLEIHSGRNRIVRRIFEALGYNVEKLDRVMYAGLTKKNLPRGKWRELSEKEIIMLKHFKS